VTPRLRAWLLILIVLVVCGAMLWGAVWYRSRGMTTAAMLKRLPTADAVVLFIDVAQLRRANILDLLDNAKVGQDPEYQQFIRKIEFDFRKDLDSALLSIAPGGNYMLLKGRFEWKALKDYAISVDGKCNNSVCRLVGSTPERRISFFPLQPNLMALAVSQDESAATRMNDVAKGPDPEAPDAPIWLSLPPSVFRSRGGLPAGTQMFARILENTQGATLWLAPDGQGFAAMLNARCANVSEAVELASELTKATMLTRRLIESEHQTPNPGDFSGPLTAGTFHNEGTRLVGKWPIQRVLVENLLSGK
jgi:hypothetical protein